MHISWLRKKLGDEASRPRFITTVRGVGFRFERG
jgi:DNA-binding response OmpR family regulator